jgi:predicted MFS family arabinose efflux permease
VGTATSIGAAGGVVGSLLASRIVRRFSSRTLLIVMSWLVAMAAVGMALSPHPLLVGASLALLALLTVPVSVLIETAELNTVPDELIGRVTSAVDFSAQGLRWAGPVGAGLLVNLLGPVAATLSLACVFLLFAVAGHVVRPLRLLDSVNTASTSRS